MARYTGAVCRLCRREGTKLYLKGERCYSDKCGITRRPNPPGERPPGRKKVSEYGMQLREKQKARRFYGVLERQFKKYFEMAEKMKGVTGENLFQILERRLDNVVYRIGLGSSRAQARQFVCHGHIQINGKRVDIPSYLVNPGETIKVQDISKGIERFKEVREGDARAVLPKWLEIDAENLEAKVVALPFKEDLDIDVQDHLIVELYSR